MLCIGHCNPDGTHDPETVDEFREVLAERDETIARLRAELSRERMRR